MDNMSWKQIRNYCLFLLLTVVIHLIIVKTGVFEEESKLAGGLSDRVWAVLKNDYLYKDRIDERKIYYGGISGEVMSLGDPYTVFLAPSDNKMSQENLAGEFGGVGISLGYKDGVLAVMSPLAKTPAEKAGLRAGDLITKIKQENGDEVETSEINIEKAVELIRGKIGSKVWLTIARQGEEDSFEVELVRDNIVVTSVEMEEVTTRSGKKIAWLKLYKFSDRLFEEWNEIVDKVVKSGADTIVLDLRNNPGGYLEGSVSLASDFMRQGVVVKQKDASGQVKDYEVVKNRARLMGKKLYVLINQGSASAAEILAGALRQNSGAILLGETSFGKGTVQKTEDFTDGSGLHVTIAKWLLPDGSDIDGVGVKPDVEIDWKYDETDKEAWLGQIK